MRSSRAASISDDQLQALSRSRRGSGETRPKRNRARPNAVASASSAHITLLGAAPSQLTDRSTRLNGDRSSEPVPSSLFYFAEALTLCRLEVFLACPPDTWTTSPPPFPARAEPARTCASHDYRGRRAGSRRSLTQPSSRHSTPSTIFPWLIKAWEVPRGIPGTCTGATRPETRHIGCQETRSPSRSHDGLFRKTEPASGQDQ
jgi:hypothetical protein